MLPGKPAPDLINNNPEGKEIKLRDLKGKVVLVDFWAGWCGPCQVLGPDIEEVAAEVDDVKICKVGVDQCMDLARLYKVVSIPMLVEFENGEVTGKLLGLISKEEVLHLIGK